jgi:hypothetical protein
VLAKRSRGAVLGGLRRSFARSHVTVAGGVRRVWYTIPIAGNAGDAVVVKVPRHALPGAGERLVSGDCPPVDGPMVDDGWFVWTCKLVGTSATLGMAVSGADADTVVDASGTIRVAVAGAEKAFPNRHVLKPTSDPFVQAVFGGGLAKLRDDHEDFVVKDGALE